MSKQDIYVNKMKSELDTLNARLKEIEASAAETAHDAQERYKAEVDKLRDQSRQAGLKLDEITAATEKSWHKMVSDMEKIRHAFTSSFHYFKSQVATDAKD